MKTLPLAALFFDTGKTDEPTNDIAKLDSLLKSAKEISTFIIVSRTSRTGSSRVNKKISLNRAVFARNRMEMLAPNHAATMASYEGKRLYLTYRDAAAYGLDPHDYNGSIQHLNQSVFVYRFDCAVGVK